jgi:hypothetical protein
LSILEDYIGLGGLGFNVLMSRMAPNSFKQNIQAAIISSSMGISLDYARKRYVNDIKASIPRTYDIFQRIYYAGKSHIDSTFERFSEGAEPDAGVLYSEVALRRLPATYFAAGLLYRVGNLFEANAVARMFLEQVAWAYQVFECKDWDSACRVSSTKAVGRLKEIFPRAGELYGLYSNDAHLELKQHGKFIQFEQPPKILMSLGADSWMFGLGILELSDMFSCVYELTQLPYIAKPENWKTIRGALKLNPKRPFLSKAGKLRREWRKIFLGKDTDSKKR